MSVTPDFHSVPVGPVGGETGISPIEGPQAWRGPEMARRHTEWTYRLTPPQIAELIAATRSFVASGADFAEFSKKALPLPSWASLIETVRQDMFEGRGFCLLRGFPVEEFTPVERIAGYLGIGAQMGVATAQNAKGHLVGHICDIGIDYHSPTGRGYQTNAMLPFHTDSADIVGLLCVNKSSKGGLSSLVSSVTLFNEMTAQRPDLVRALMGPVYRDRQDEIPEGQGPYYIVPVFNPFHGRVFTSYVRGTVRKAQRFPELPPISAELDEAMDLLDGLANDPEFHLCMDFEPGDIQFLCNHFILHSRTEFEDPPDPANRRHLLRLHLSCADGPALPPAFENLRGYDQNGRPAGFNRKDLKLIAPAEPVDGGPGDTAQRLRG